MQEIFTLYWYENDIYNPPHNLVGSFKTLKDAKNAANEFYTPIRKWFRIEEGLADKEGNITVLTVYQRFHNGKPYSK